MKHAAYGLIAAALIYFLIGYFPSEHDLVHDTCRKGKLIIIPCVVWVFISIISKMTSDSRKEFERILNEKVE